MLSMILLILCFVLIIGIIFLLMVGGKFLKAKIKEFLPFYKGKYNWVITYLKGGPIVVDYVNTEHGSVKTTSEDTQLGNTEHSFIDQATQDQATIHSYDKKPAYVIVEGCPLNVLVKKRNYRPTVIEIQKYKKKIKEIINKQDVKYSVGLANLLFNKFKKLNDAFKYLPKGQVILAKTFKDYKPDHEYSLEDINKYLKAVHNGMSELQELLKDKDKSMINFTDYFSSGNLAKIFNKRFQEAQANGRLQMAEEQNGPSKLLTAGGVVLVIVLLIFGFLIIRQGNQIDTLNQTLLDQTSELSTKLDDLNTTASPVVNPNLNQNPISNNNGGNNSG